MFEFLLLGVALFVGYKILKNIRIFANKKDEPASYPSTLSEEANTEDDRITADRMHLEESLVKVFREKEEFLSKLGYVFKHKNPGFQVTRTKCNSYLDISYGVLSSCNGLNLGGKISESDEDCTRGEGFFITGMVKNIENDNKELYAYFLGKEPCDVLSYLAAHLMENELFQLEMQETTGTSCSPWKSQW